MQLFSDIANLLGCLYIIITIHELGHATTAWLYGVGIKEISIGLGPIFRITVFNFDLFIGLPIGGYTLYEGALKSRYAIKPTAQDYWPRPSNQKIVILLAGVAFNVISAAIFYYAGWPMLAKLSIVMSALQLLPFIKGTDGWMLKQL